MITRIRVHWTILRISIEERLIYRADFALGTLLRFMPIVTTILLWQAIFNGVSPTSESSKETTIDSYRFSDMVSYYLLVMLGRAFSSMPGLASGIAQDVRDGTIKKYLVQPIDLLGFLFWSRVAHKLIYYLVAAGPFAIMFILCHSFLPGWPDAGTLIGAIVALILGFIIGFLFEATVGLISFWFLEVSSLLFIVMMLNYFLSGHMFPLDLLPGPIAAAITAVVQEGFEPELAIANGGLDANWLMLHGIPTVSLGCGQKNIHTTSEQLDIKEFLTARRIALRLATDIESR